LEKIDRVKEKIKESGFAPPKGRGTASGMITLKMFCADVKALTINFFQKNFFLPDA